MQRPLAAAILLAAISSPAQGPTPRTIQVEQDTRARIDERLAVLELAARELDRVRYADEPEPPLFRSFAEARGQQVSVAMLEAISKRFSDRLLATLELHVDKTARVPFLADLQRVVKSRSASPWLEADRRITAALRLGAPEGAGRDAGPDGVGALIAAFLADPVRSKPLGFYTWSEELARSFRMERFLQRPEDLRAEGAWLVSLGSELRDDPALAKRYAWLVSFGARVTGPSRDANLLDLRGAERAAMFPPSRTREGELLRRLYGDRPVPEDIELMDAFLAAVRAGKAELTPAADSGFYDWQLFGLEPLARAETASEAKKVLRHATYQKLCDLAFKGVMTLRRETHVKRADAVPVGSAAPPRIDVRVTPALTIEPQITWLVRTADGYAFLERALVELFGEGALAELRLVDESMSRGEPVLASLRAVERRFRALAALSCEEIGGEPGWIGTGVDAKQAAALADEARAYLASAEWSQDLAYDPRVIVPFAVDVETGKRRCWATIGVQRQHATADYRTAPGVTIVDANGDPVAVKLSVETGTQHLNLPSLAFVECQVKVPLTRAELRRLCDEHRTVEAIKAALAKR